MSIISCHGTTIPDLQHCHAFLFHSFQLTMKAPPSHYAWQAAWISRMEAAQGDLRKRMAKGGQHESRVPSDVLRELQPNVVGVAVEGKAGKGSRIPTKRRTSMRILSYDAKEPTATLQVEPSDGAEQSAGQPVPSPPVLPPAATRTPADWAGLHISCSPFISDAASSGASNTTSSLVMPSPASPPKSVHRPRRGSAPTSSEVGSMPTPASPPKSVHHGRRPPVGSASSEPIETVRSGIRTQVSTAIQGWRDSQLPELHFLADVDVTHRLQPSLIGSPPMSVGGGRLPRPPNTTADQAAPLHKQSIPISIAPTVKRPITTPNPNPRPSGVVKSIRVGHA